MKQTFLTNCGVFLEGLTELLFLLVSFVLFLTGKKI